MLFRRGGHGTRTTGCLDGKEAAVAVQAAAVAVVCMVRVRDRSRDSVGQDAVADDGSGADETETVAINTTDASDACVCYSNGHG